MKAVPWIIAGVALIAGFLLGGVAPRRDAAKLQARIDELEEQAFQAKRDHSGTVTRYMPMPGLDKLPARPHHHPAPAATTTPEGTGEETPEDSERPYEMSPEDMEMFNTAVDAQRVRAAQSRAALREQGKLDDAKMAEVDEIVAAMNDALSEYADEILDMIESGEEPTPLEVLGLSHEVTGILYDSQVALEETVGGGMGNVDQNAGVVWNYVDLEIFRAAAESAAEQNQP